MDYDSQDTSWNLTHFGGSPAHQHVTPEGNAGATSSSETQSHISKLASIDSFDSKWYAHNFALCHLALLISRISLLFTVDVLASM